MCSLNALIIFRYIFVGQWHYLRVDIKTHFHFSLFWVPFAILINTTLNCSGFKNLIKAVDFHKAEKHRKTPVHQNTTLSYIKLLMLNYFWSWKIVILNGLASQECCRKKEITKFKIHKPSPCKEERKPRCHKPKGNYKLWWWLHQGELLQWAGMVMCGQQLGRCRGDQVRPLRWMRRPAEGALWAGWKVRKMTVQHGSSMGPEPTWVFWAKLGRKGLGRGSCLVSN